MPLSLCERGRERSEIAGYARGDGRGFPPFPTVIPAKAGIYMQPVDWRCRDPAHLIESVALLDH